MPSVSEAVRERKSVDFKASFDGASPGDWCELIKDLVAMANSAGGHILVGVNDDGSLSRDPSVSYVLKIDPAAITDKIAKYTGVQFDGVSVFESKREGSSIAVLEVHASDELLLFEKVGNYQSREGKQKTAFGQGTIYFRHGAKSEPGTANDVRQFLDRRLASLRRQWLSGVRKIVAAPIGSVVTVSPTGVTQSRDPSAVPIRITDDPNAPQYRLVNPDETHPLRQKEVIGEVNREARPSPLLNQHSFRAIRAVHSADAKPEFVHKSKFSSPQYSLSFVEWLKRSIAEDPLFVTKAAELFRIL